jgi:hypothetical protein
MPASVRDGMVKLAIHRSVLQARESSAAATRRNGPRSRRANRVPTTARAVGAPESLHRARLDGPFETLALSLTIRDLTHQYWVPVHQDGAGIQSAANDQSASEVSPGSTPAHPILSDARLNRGIVVARCIGAPWSSRRPFYCHLGRSALVEVSHSRCRPVYLNPARFELSPATGNLCVGDVRPEA